MERSNMGNWHKDYEDYIRSKQLEILDGNWDKCEGQKCNCHRHRMVTNDARCPRGDLSTPSHAPGCKDFRRHSFTRLRRHRYANDFFLS